MEFSLKFMIIMDKNAVITIRYNIIIQGVSKVPGRLDNLKNMHHREK